MPFDGSSQRPAGPLAFMADHNLTAGPFLARMDMRELRHWYEGCAYQPRTKGLAYDMADEPDNMFGFDPDDPNLVPTDRVYHDETDHGAQNQQFDDLPRPGRDMQTWSEE